ncbi:MAG TPA: rhomboid family intramembrane serine protease [Chromatiaceae bacterium]|jgi:membrane associated rhomboid family serine protease|nr:rhomboid family intramembrane serine protease [Chromatiaceae bacterium]HIN83072.1 rhomboid family intramembrane serine protease [Chromatiales bacterium]HIA09195.1 rhomboid family intramembrane serine protease [Chromatiaceae bacterium]HIB85215.1 rhomboid family intramembrane serine protease [Chromatiaceae bacterium]HIO14651.1 rhomboid family intramembrane serine protease [Chromatiales bacterium]
MIPLHDDNPTQITPFVTIGLIGICIATFLWEVSLGENTQAAIFSFGVIPAVLFDQAALNPDLAQIPAWATAFTSMFLHGGWMHLIGNMLYLWIFGNNIEDAMGHTRFILFYLLCGIAAVFAQALPDPGSTVPMVGASGAISGVLGAYLLLYPRAKVLVLIPLGVIFFNTRIAAGLVLGFWFVMQLINSAMAGDQQGGVAFGAHIGGFIAGMLLIKFFKHPSIPFFAPARRG